MSDPDVDQAEQHARAYIVRTLAPYLVAGVDGDALATHIVGWIRKEGWWPRLKPPAAARPADPAQAAERAHRGADLARQLLNPNGERP